MPRRSPASSAAPVPFDPATAHAVRYALGFSPAMVARSLAESYAMPVPPSLVIAWETGAAHPSERELIALARVLWCLPGQLMGGREESLRDHRLALDLPQEAVARRLRVTPREYAKLEVRWTGDRNLTRDLAEVLRLDSPTLVRVCGREEQLEEVLRRAVDGRWQTQVGPVLDLVPTLSERWVAHALQALAAEKATSSALWGASSTPAPTKEPEVGPLERFWTLVSPV